MSETSNLPDAPPPAGAIALVVGDLRDALARLRRGEVVVPPVASTWRSRWQRFLFGLSAPFVLGNLAVRDDELKAPTLRVLLMQASAAAALGVLWLAGADRASRGAEAALRDAVSGVEGAKVQFGFTLESPLEFAAAFVGALALTEWLVIALSREWHDLIGVWVSQRAGVPPDEDIAVARVRLNGRWLWMKTKRRVQSVFVTLTSLVPLLVFGVPVWLTLAAVSDAVAGAVVTGVVTLVFWYWVSVIALGKTSWAWRNDVDVDPVYLRGLDRVAGASWLFFPFRIWAWALRKAMALVVRPARLLEHCAWEAFGLGAARAIMSVPLAYVVVRPFFPVAATLVLQARAPHAFVAPTPPTEPTEPTEPTATTTTTAPPATMTTE